MLHLVINLDDSIERMESVAAKLSALNISFERVSAVNGRSLTDMEFTNLVYPLDHFDSKVRFTRQLTRGEVGCFLSHIKCWQKLLASDEDWALIMEDDIQISDFAPRFMKSTDWIPNGIQMCQLSCLYRTQDALIDPFDKIELDLGYSLVRPLFPHPLGTQCYLISRDAASKALQLSKKLVAPVDNFLFSPWFDFAKQNKIWRISPVLVIPNEEIDSDIGVRSKKSVQKAPFFIRHSFTRMKLDREVKKMHKNGIPHFFEFK